MASSTYVEELHACVWFSYGVNYVTKWWYLSVENQMQVRRMLDGVGVKAVLVDGASNLVKIR